MNLHIQAFTAPLLLLAACGPPLPPGAECGADGAQRYIGSSIYDADLRDHVNIRYPNAAPFTYSSPFNLNVDVDYNGIIRAAYCG